MIKDNILTLIGALVSVALGWLLHEISQWFKTRSDDKKVKRQVLFHLLEVAYRLNQLNDVPKFVDRVTDKVIAMMPKDERVEGLKDFINTLYNDLFTQMIGEKVDENLKEIEQAYSNALEELAKIDPLIAYRLKGKNTIMGVFDLIEKYGAEAGNRFPDQANEIEEKSKTIFKTVKPDILNDAIKGLEEELVNVAFSIDILTWYRVKSTIKTMKYNIADELDKKIDNLLNKAMPPFQ